MIPFFFLDCGKIRVFQAGNTKDLHVKTTIARSENENLVITRQGHVEVRNNELFLNGTQGYLRFNFTKVHSPNIQNLIKLLKTVEGDY